MIAQKRAKNVTIAGLVCQFIVTAVLLGVWLWTGRPQSALATLWLLGGGLSVWLVAAVLFYCRQLQQQEALEIEEIARSGQPGSIFEEKGQGRPAQARLDFMYRWVVPIFTLLLAAYHGVFGTLLLRWGIAGTSPAWNNLMPAALFTALLWFLSFLFSRYATGMGRSPEWRPLRAAGSYLLFCSIGVAATAASLVGVDWHYAGLDRIVAIVLPAVQILLAVELALNFVLDLYRPRLPGQEQHLSFDSRMLGLLAEPQRVGHSIAETLNYQFGFEVSGTWFYQLLSRALVPLLVFGAVVLFAITSLVIVPQGEQAIVLHWGQLDPLYKTNPQQAILTPGLHLKWPWPVETVRRFQTGSVQELWMGAGRNRTEAELKAARASTGGKDVELWTAEHGPREELNFLVAVPASRRPATVGDEKQRAPAVTIIKLVVPVQYVVKDPFQYSLTYSDPRKMLECVAHREMVEYCARATLTEPVGGDDSDRPEAIMTFGREKAAAALKDRIQKAADALGLGVQITNVTLLAVHPPSDAAGAYEKIGEAERRQDVQRYQAQAEANQKLTRAAGDAQLALQLALALRRVNDLERLRDSSSAGAEADRLIADIRNTIKFHQDEIQRERALGRLTEARRQAVGALIDAYTQHLAVLEQAKAKGKAFDFAGALAQARKTIEGDGKTPGLLDRASGDIGVRIANARSDRWQTELAEHGRSLAFGRELAAFDACPQVYTTDRWLDVWDSVLPGVTKYVLAIPQDRVEVRVNAEIKASDLGGVGKLEGN